MEVEKFSEGVFSTEEFNNPQHFINLVSPKLREAILQIPPHYFRYSELQLVSNVYKGELPDVMDHQLRLAFWEEYESCFKTCKQMSNTKIYSGSCSERHFYMEFIHQVGRLAFVVSQPTIVANRLKYNFHLAMDEMTKLLRTPTPINSKTGTPDGKILDVKYKIFEYLDQRLHGSIIQRQQIDTKNLNINVDANNALTQIPQTPDAIDARLKELELEFSTISLPKHNSEIIHKEPTPLMEKVVIESGRVSSDFTRTKTER